MTLDIKAMVIVFLYALISNLVIVSIGNSTGGITCPNMSSTTYSYDYSTGDYTVDSESQEAGVNIFKLMLNRCQGLAWWLYWLTQVPTILGVLYIIRAFVGFT